MGAAAAVIGGGLLGLGASAMMSKQPSYSMPSTVASAMTPGRPAVPETPTLADASSTGTATNNALMEAERERERQAALARRQQAQEVFTSGLGASGVAQTAKKTLLGG